MLRDLCDRCGYGATSQTRVEMARLTRTRPERDGVTKKQLLCDLQHRGAHAAAIVIKKDMSQPKNRDSFGLFALLTPKLAFSDFRDRKTQPQFSRPSWRQRDQTQPFPYFCNRGGESTTFATKAGTM